MIFIRLHTLLYQIHVFFLLNTVVVVISINVTAKASNRYQTLIGTTIVVPINRTM